MSPLESSVRSSETHDKPIRGIELLHGLSPDGTSRRAVRLNLHDSTQISGQAEERDGVFPAGSPGQIDIEYLAPLLLVGQFELAFASSASGAE